MRAFREQGKTPTFTKSNLNQSELIRGELSADLVKPHVSPLSTRSGMGGGYLGAVTEVSNLEYR